MSRRINLETIQKIKELRQKGYSMPEIKEEVKVGHGTIFRYIKDVKILPEFYENWHIKRGGSLKRKILAEEKALKKAKQIISNFCDKEKIIFLCALYWGEGTKSDFGLSNTDPDLIKVFIAGLKNLFGVRAEDLRISIRIYEDLDKNLCLKFWSQITGVPVEQFVGVNVLKGTKIGKLPYGMCRVRVLKGGDLLKYILALKRELVCLF